MQLKELPTKETIGLILAHSCKLESQKISKGTLIDSKIVNSLINEQVSQILCAIPNESDLHENEAANLIANAIDKKKAFSGIASTGRVNFKSNSLGIVRYDRSVIKELNLIDESIAFSIVQHNQLLAPNDLIATLKIIPFFVSKSSVEKAVNLIRRSSLFEFHGLKKRKCSLLQTRFNWQRSEIFKATTNVTKDRLKNLDCSISKDRLINHNLAEISKCIRDYVNEGTEILLISGASAIIDRTDDIPKAILQEGGEVFQYGLAVDPGNLLLIGKISDMTIIGMPGCARSPKLNGLDWVLQLLLAEINIDKEELAEMGAGGLLMEIASRPLPRSLNRKISKPRKLFGALLAGGNSKRMGKDNKLLVEIEGIPLVRKIVLEMLNSNLDGCQVVLGYEAEKVAEVLKDLPVQFLVNPLWKNGQASSLKTAVENLDTEVSDLLVMLADLPGVTSKHIKYLIENHFEDRSSNNIITVPCHKGQRGNPVIWSEAFFPDLVKLDGDTGGRVLFPYHPAAMNLVEVHNDCVITDTNTPQELNLWLEREGK